MDIISLRGVSKVYGDWIHVLIQLLDENVYLTVDKYIVQSICPSMEIILTSLNLYNVHDIPKRIWDWILQHTELSKPVALLTVRYYCSILVIIERLLAPVKFISSADSFKSKVASSFAQMLALRASTAYECSNCNCAGLFRIWLDADAAGYSDVSKDAAVRDELHAEHLGKSLFYIIYNYA